MAPYYFWFSLNAQKSMYHKWQFLIKIWLSESQKVWECCMCTSLKKITQPLFRGYSDFAVSWTFFFFECFLDVISRWFFCISNFACVAFHVVIILAIDNYWKTKEIKNYKCFPNCYVNHD